jgi:ATP-dependent Clp protease ATP-binding subunit ClpX
LSHADDNKKDEESVNLLSKVTPDDLEEFGLIPEFIGRIPVVTALNELTADDLVDIMYKPENSIISQYKKVFEEGGKKFTHTRGGLRAVARRAKEHRTGARALRTIMEGILMMDMFEENDVHLTEKYVQEKLKND